MRARPLLAVAAAAALTAGAFAVTAGASASTTRPHHVTSSPHVTVHGLRPASNISLPRTLPHLTSTVTGASYNWSGFAAVANRGVALRYVSATWNLPSIDPSRCQPGSSGYSEVSHLVGLDGLGRTPNGNTTTVEEIGVNAACDSSGTLTYDAWYEMYPNQPVAYTGINPGDAVSANVFYDTSTKKYNLTLDDLTSNIYLHADGLSCPSKSVCKNATAETITSAPGGGPQYGYNLADFGMVNYTNAGVTSRSGSRGTLADSKLWTSADIYMVSQTTGHRMATPSSLEGGKAFSVTWNAGS